MILAAPQTRRGKELAALIPITDLETLRSIPLPIHEVMVDPIAEVLVVFLLAVEKEERVDE
jgi:hypothetical protein